MGSHSIQLLSVEDYPKPGRQADAQVVLLSQNEEAQVEHSEEDGPKQSEHPESQVEHSPLLKK